MQAGAGLRLPLPEPGKRAQHDRPSPPRIPTAASIYTAAAGGQSPAGKTPDGGLRSYGSMTYAGLKSMIYAGVGADDPRVKAAVQVDPATLRPGANPGMGEAGLYYYYQTFAKALDASGLSEFDDASGVKHDWRRDLVDANWSSGSGPTALDQQTTAGWKATPAWSPATRC